MRLLIDVLHPAHVHFFRHIRTEMRARGHEVLVTARDKDMTLALLDELRIPHIVLSAQGRGGLGLATELVARTAKLARLARKFRPDAMAGIMGPSIAPVARLRRIPSFVFYDTETATATNPWVFRLASHVCTPVGFECAVPANYRRYPATQEFAYLHPDRFTPDRARLEPFGVTPDEDYYVARFVSWEASHDRGHSGLSAEGIMRALGRLAEHGRVLVSAEGDVPPGLGEAVLGPPGDIHHLLAFSKGLLGDSGTMSLEAAALGRPALFVSTADLSVINWVGTTFGLIDRIAPRSAGPDLLAAIDRLASDEKAAEAAAGHARLLGDGVDVTRWSVATIEDAVASRPGEATAP